MLLSVKAHAPLSPPVSLRSRCCRSAAIVTSVTAAVVTAVVGAIATTAVNSTTRVDEHGELNNRAGSYKTRVSHHAATVSRSGKCNFRARVIWSVRVRITLQPCGVEESFRKAYRQADQY